MVGLSVILIGFIFIIFICVIGLYYSKKIYEYKVNKKLCGETVYVNVSGFRVLTRLTIILMLLFVLLLGFFIIREYITSSEENNIIYMSSYYDDKIQIKIYNEDDNYFNIEILNQFDKPIIMEVDFDKNEIYTSKGSSTYSSNTYGSVSIKLDISKYLMVNIKDLNQNLITNLKLDISDYN